MAQRMNRMTLAFAKAAVTAKRDTNLSVVLVRTALQNRQIVRAT